MADAMTPDYPKSIALESAFSSKTSSSVPQDFPYCRKSSVRLRSQLSLRTYKRIKKRDKAIKPYLARCY